MHFGGNLILQNDSPGKVQKAMSRCYSFRAAAVSFPHHLVKEGEMAAVRG